MVTLLAYSVVSILAFLAATIQSWNIHGQFYPTMLYLSSSGIRMLTLGNFGLCCIILFGKLIKWMYFGKLRQIEVERVFEKSTYTLTETLFALTIFRDTFSFDLIAMFIVLLFLKIFHWLASDRVNFIPQAPIVTLATLIRLFLVMIQLLFADLILTYVAVSSLFKFGPSMMLIFAFEFAVLSATIISVFIKYSLHTTDIYYFDGQWDTKGSIVFYVELIADVFNLTTYIIFFGMVMYHYGLPLHILRDIYITFVSLKQRVMDLIRYRRATANMNELYPDATQEEIQALTDPMCIICREELVTGKKLPCGHIFHFRCLRSWLERRQTCPTCLRDVLEPTDQPLDAREDVQADVPANQPPVVPPVPLVHPDHIPFPPPQMDGQNQGNNVPDGMYTPQRPAGGLPQSPFNGPFPPPFIPPSPFSPFAPFDPRFMPYPPTPFPGPPPPHDVMSTSFIQFLNRLDQDDTVLSPDMGKGSSSGSLNDLNLEETFRKTYEDLERQRESLTLQIELMKKIMKKRERSERE